jgi:ribosome-binding factor A
MSSRRVQKVAEAIRQVVSTAILTELWDPRIQDVTVTHVEVSGDLRQAKIYISVMGEESKQKLAQRGLQHAAGFLQSKIATRLQLRYTPVLQFVLDQGVKRSIEMTRLINEVMTDSTSQGPTAAPEDAPEKP